MWLEFLKITAEDLRNFLVKSFVFNLKKIEEKMTTLNKDPTNKIVFV